jgi:hypothetical protein
VNKHYEYHKRDFIQFCKTRDGWEPSLEMFERYRMDLARNQKYESDRAIKWAACWQEMKRASGIDTETLVQKKALYEHRYPFPRRRCQSIYRITELEYRRLIESDATPRQKLFIEIIHSLDAKVSQAIHIKRDSPIVPQRLKSVCAMIFGTGVFLMETQTGNPYDRTYVSNEIRKVCKKVLGKSLSAESMRPRKYAAGRVSLDA